jgi:hypothetical protein
VRPQQLLSIAINDPRISEAASMMPDEFLSFPAGLLRKPIPLAEIVTMQFLFVVASDKSFCGVFWGPLDGFPSEVNEDLRFFPADSFNPLG